MRWQPETLYDWTMRSLVLSIIFGFLGFGAAFAQQTLSPLQIEGGGPVPLAGANPPKSARAGDRYLLSFAVRNRAGTPVRLRRIALRVPEGLEIVNPNADRIDNDRDGELDEGDEAATRIEGIAHTWRIPQSAEAVEPGEAIERAVIVRILPTAEAGSAPELEIFAAASNDDASIRTERSVAFSLNPPRLDLKMRAASRLDPDEKPRLEASFLIPSGRIDDLSLTLEGTPSIESYRNAGIEIGEGISCESEGTPSPEARSLKASLGTCFADPAQSDPARTIRLYADAVLKDADPFTEPSVVQAARRVKVTGLARSAERTIGKSESVEARIVGPLIGAQLVESPEGEYDAGDTLRVTYHLVNRGDTPVRRLVLLFDEDGRVDCESLTLKGHPKQEGACQTGMSLTGGLDIGEAKDIQVSVRLRNDARFTGEPKLQASVQGDERPKVRLPDVFYNLALPSAPVLSLTPDSEWRLRNAIVSTRIGDLATVQVTGALPEGRYEASLRLLSRLVNAQTGEPIAPAPLLIDGVDIKSPDKPSPPRPVGKTEAGWMVTTIPFGDLKIPVGADEDGKRFDIHVDLALRDRTEARAGRMLELTAELDIFGDKTVTGESWIEALIVEPELDLTLRSLDEDRLIELDTGTEAAALTCNRGTAAAHAIVVDVRIPPGLVVDDSRSPHFLRVSKEFSEDSAKLFSATGKELGEVVADEDGHLLRGVMDKEHMLAPESCAALLFGIRRSGRYDAGRSVAMIEASIEPYTGHGGSGARIYPGLPGSGIRFALPQVHFGPLSELEVGSGSGEMIAHTVSLEIPPGVGPYHVDLTTESTAGLDWTILSLGENGAANPWRNGTSIEPETTLTLRFETPRPEALPLGWVDTTLVRALVLSSSGGDPLAVSTSLISRRNVLQGGEMTVKKLLALDRDCDGDIDDERGQDALFEPVKDAEIGDCVIFRVAFRHDGNKDMEQIVLRDQVPPGTELRTDAIEILRAPKPLHSSEVLPPEPGHRSVVWRFEGLFKPGAEGEVGYAVKLTGEASELQQ